MKQPGQHTIKASLFLPLSEQQAADTVPPPILILPPSPFDLQQSSPDQLPGCYGSWKPATLFILGLLSKGGGDSRWAKPPCPKKQPNQLSRWYLWQTKGPFASQWQLGGGGEEKVATHQLRREGGGRERLL